VKECPMVGYFPNNATRTCDPCNSLCALCINDENDCISCQPGSFYTNRKCQNSCGNNMYASAAGFCYPCDASCKVCNGSLNS